jgi:hypothetical protein
MGDDRVMAGASPAARRPARRTGAALPGGVRSGHSRRCPRLVRVTELRALLDRLRPRLVTFRDATGKELFDLPDAPRPERDTPAPPRFLPEYDNVLLSHADRTRINPDGHPIPLLPGNGAAGGTVLIDGFFNATWRIARQRTAASIVIEPLTRTTRTQRTAVSAEARRLLAFLAPEADSHSVSVAAQGSSADATPG